MTDEPKEDVVMDDSSVVDNAMDEHFNVQDNTPNDTIDNSN